MLLLIISLFLNYDLFSCVDSQRSKFNETIIIKQHHKNYLEVKTFIKEAQKKFHKDTPPPREDYPHYTTTDIPSRDNTSSAIDLDQNTHLFVPFARARPSFPISITPYTTELNAHQLKWDEIYPLLTTRKSVPWLRVGPKLSSTQEIPSRPPLEITYPSPKYQKRFGPTFYPDLSRLRINHVVSSTQKNRPNPELSSKTFTPSLRNQTSNSHDCTRPFHPNSTLHTSRRGHSGKDFKLNPSFMTPNEEYKKKWLREITTYTPVESWFLTLANKIGLTPRFSLTSLKSPPPAKQAFQPARAHSKTQVSGPRKQLKTYTKHQEQLQSVRKGLLTPKTVTKVDGFTASIVTTKAKYFIENQGGILHLRTIPEKDEAKTTTVGKRLGPVAKDVEMKINVTTGYMLLREQQQAAFKVPSKKKSRRLHSKPRKRHRYLRHKNGARQRHQRHKYRHPAYSYQDVYRRKQEELKYPSSRSRKHGEPTQPPNAMLQFSEYITYDTEHEIPYKLTETQKESRRSQKAQKDKISFFNKVKETLKQAESKTKAKRLEIKAELIRKIVEGSSYSDEEESLRKNLGHALKNGNRI